MNSVTVAPLRADFGLEIKFQPRSPDPARVFRAMSSLIGAFQYMDRHLVSSVEAKIEPLLLLEDIESGSLRTWLTEQLEALDDSTLKEGDWKKILGHYLVRGKHIVVSFLDRTTSITSREQVAQLEGELLQAAQETNVKRIPAYQPIDRRALLEGIQQIGDALANLRSEDSAELITPLGHDRFNLAMRLAPETIDELTVNESIEHMQEMILKVKKP